MDSHAGPEAVPPSLAEAQAWFGRAISTPLPGSYGGNPLADSSPELAAEARARLRSPSAFDGFARLGVYNQQYWFRLVSVMQADYSCTIHLMGLKRFNDWAVRYLQAHPPASPFLADLDADFPAYLAERYDGPEAGAVIQAAAYERALSRAFDAPEGEPLAAAGPAAAASARLRLAPHATALRLDRDFAAYRALCLDDESLEAGIPPPAEASVDCVVYRDAALNVRVEEIPGAARQVLQAFPGTVEEVFARLQGRLSGEDEALLEREVSGWFGDWVSRGWLCLDRTLPA